MAAKLLVFLKDGHSALQLGDDLEILMERANEKYLRPFLLCGYYCCGSIVFRAISNLFYESMAREVAH